MKIFLVRLTDGTDEIFNLCSYEITFKEGETAGDAWARFLLQEWQEWDDDDFCDGFDGFAEWLEGCFWMPMFCDPNEMIDLQNAGNKHVFNDGLEFLTIENLLPVLDVLKQIPGVVT